METKIRIFNTNVKSVTLYGAENFMTDNKFNHEEVTYLYEQLN